MKTSTYTYLLYIVYPDVHVDVLFFKTYDHILISRIYLHIPSTENNVQVMYVYTKDLYDTNLATFKSVDEVKQHDFGSRQSMVLFESTISAS